jgi:signal peptidase II
VSLHHIDNSGAAFGLFPNAQLLFLAVAVIVSGYILLAGRRLGAAFSTQLILGGILGGALSNAIDRATQGHVVDYVDLHFWPIFNVADVCIVLGTIAALLFIRTPPSSE